MFFRSEAGSNIFLKPTLFGLNFDQGIEKEVEMWYCRHILLIPWTDRVRNTEVLTPLGKEMEVHFEVKRRKLQYFSHVLRNEKYRLLHLIMEGKIEGQARQKKNFMAQEFKGLVWTRKHVLVSGNGI